MKQNGEAIYGTRPWKRAAGETTEGIRIRFTQKNSVLYATLLGKPKTNTVTLKSLSANPDSNIYLLGGDSKPLAWSQQGDDIRITLPAALPGKYAFVLRITGSGS
jgi:alpha-L-fucosidase